MWKRLIPAFLPLAVLLVLPLYLRPAPDDVKGSSGSGKPDSLVIVTPHTEQIRYEIDHAFRRYYREKFCWGIYNFRSLSLGKRRQ